MSSIATGCAVVVVDAVYWTEGFLIFRACETCCCTTYWEYTVVKGEENGKPGKLPRDRWNAGRAPLWMKIRVVRWKRVIVTENIRETRNVSRQGAHFLFYQSYVVGEELKVMLPCEENQPNIETDAKVV